MPRYSTNIAHMILFDNNDKVLAKMSERRKIDKLLCCDRKTSTTIHYVRKQINLRRESYYFRFLPIAIRVESAFESLLASSIR
jgi:hypothetical protein